VSATPSSLQTELRVLNPATLAEVGVVAATEPEGIGEIVAESRLAQERWARQPPAIRRRLLRDVARVLLESTDEIADTIVAETAKPRLEAITTEVFVCLDTLVWLARNAERALRPERLRFPQPHLLHKKAWLSYEPLGVVAVVSPWNFPFSIPFTQAATAVAAGNAAVVKPAELTPLSGALVEEVFRRAGAPSGLVRVVQGAGEVVGDALVRARGVGKVVFTGSGEVGRSVAIRAAERLCPVTLELGGKDPMLVLADADLDRAVEGALWGSFSNCGQICSGVERIYVEGELFEPFVARLAERARALRIGAGTDAEIELGPLISETQRSRVEELVADAVGAGAEVAAGGGRPETGLPGWFHEPTVLVGEGEGARIAEDEIFGPVVTVAKIANEEDGVRRANASAFALGASVWTRDRAKARAVAARLEAGSVWTNDVAYSYGACQAPWGGRKESGFGRTHSHQGLRELSHVKYVDADAGRFSPPWWFPYDERVIDGFQGALGALYAPGLAGRGRALWRHRRGVASLGRRALGRR
jgi:succinate-semialdehyde dehydrogenase/glutarate-semialdehyde dehydrogenase